jgi:hypothetical protein
MRYQCDDDTVYTIRTLEAIHSDGVDYFEDVVNR